MQALSHLYSYLLKQRERALKAEEADADNKILDEEGVIVEEEEGEELAALARDQAPHSIVNNPNQPVALVDNGFEEEGEIFDLDGIDSDSDSDSGDDDDGVDIGEVSFRLVDDNGNPLHSATGELHYRDDGDYTSFFRR